MRNRGASSTRDATVGHSRERLRPARRLGYVVVSHGRRSTSGRGLPAAAVPPRAEAGDTSGSGRSPGTTWIPNSSPLINFVIPMIRRQRSRCDRRRRARLPPGCGSSEAPSSAARRRGWSHSSRRRRRFRPRSNAKCDRATLGRAQRAAAERGVEPGLQRDPDPMEPRQTYSAISAESATCVRYVARVFGDDEVRKVRQRNKHHADGDGTAGRGDHSGAKAACPRATTIRQEPRTTATASGRTGSATCRAAARRTSELPDRGRA